MTIAPALRAAALAAALAAPLFGPAFAQEQLTPPSDPAYGRGTLVGAPVGHRQPRAADIPPANRTAADLLEERQQNELSRKLRICRGC